MAYEVQTFLCGIGFGAVFAYVIGGARGYTRGFDEGWGMAHRLHGLPYKRKGAIETEGG